MTLEQILAQLAVVASSATPFLPPKAQLLITLAQNAITAVKNAQNNGVDVTDEQLEALFEADNQATQDDLLAQQEAIARGDPAGG